MKFTEEQIKIISSAKTLDELIELAKSEGIEASEEEIRAYFDSVHKEGELSDDELDNVAGGICDDSEFEYPPKVYVRADTLNGTDFIYACPKCGSVLTFICTDYDKDPAGKGVYLYDLYTCPDGDRCRYYYNREMWTEDR